MSIENQGISGRNEQRENQKLNEYKQRQKEWRNISVTQLSNVNNILLTLSTGLLILGLGEIKQEHWLFPISSILICFSIIYGFAVMFTRLYDFRISRHLALCRQRYYKKITEKPLPDNDLGEFNFCQRLQVLKQIIFIKLKFINKKEIEKLENEEFKNRFNELRKTAKILGQSSWLWIKYQTLYFLLGAFTFFLFQFI